MILNIIITYKRSGVKSIVSTGFFVFDIEK